MNVTNNIVKKYTDFVFSITIALILCFLQENLNAQITKAEFIENGISQNAKIIIPIGNNSQVRQAEISFDKKYLATSSKQSSEIIVWDILTSKHRNIGCKTF